MNIATIYFPAAWNRQDSFLWIRDNHPELERGLIRYDPDFRCWKTQVYGVTQ